MTESIMCQMLSFIVFVIGIILSTSNPQHKINAKFYGMEQNGPLGSSITRSTISLYFMLSLTFKCMCQDQQCPFFISPNS
jgi:hypothetical protein